MNVLSGFWDGVEKARLSNWVRRNNANKINNFLAKERPVDVHQNIILNTAIECGNAKILQNLMSRQIIFKKDYNWCGDLLSRFILKKDVDNIVLFKKLSEASISYAWRDVLIDGVSKTIKAEKSAACIDFLRQVPIPWGESRVLLTIVRECEDESISVPNLEFFKITYLNASKNRDLMGCFKKDNLTGLRILLEQMTDLKENVKGIILENLNSSNGNSEILGLVLELTNGMALLEQALSNNRPQRWWKMSEGMRATATLAVLKNNQTREVNFASTDIVAKRENKTRL